MKSLSLLFVGDDAEVESLVHGAAHAAFGDVTAARVSSIEAALRQNVSMTTEILILKDPSRVDARLAVDATDAQGLKRWPILILGAVQSGNDFEIIPKEEWTEPTVARSLQHVVRMHEASYENSRLRGDLQSIARRFTHDLRVQLGAIVTGVEVIKEALSEQTPSRAGLTSSIFDSTDALEKLIKRVSFVLRASANPTVLEPVAMGGVVMAALERLEIRTRKRTVTIAQPESWPVVDGVASWLEVIWGNLITNALDHGGEAPRIDIGWRRDGSEYRFWVRDRSVGVAPERRRKLFQPFHLLYDPGALNGLGLPIVQRLTDLQGGQCAYEPVVEGGSCFFFSLPVPADASGSGGRF